MLFPSITSSPLTPAAALQLQAAPLSAMPILEHPLPSRTLPPLQESRCSRLLRLPLQESGSFKFDQQQPRNRE
jgi:hypothetical protein